MIKEITITANCEQCETLMDLDLQCNAYCNECVDTWMNESDLHSGLLYCADHDYHWDRCDENNVVYQDDPEKRNAFFQGVKYGYASALFWLCNYFGMDEFFEDNIGHNFEYMKKELNNQ